MFNFDSQADIAKTLIAIVLVILGARLVFGHLPLTTCIAAAIILPIIYKLFVAKE